MSESTGEERGIEIAVSVGGFVGTGLLLQWIGRSNCPFSLSPAAPDIFGNVPTPPNPLMCALSGANGTLLSWFVGALIFVGVIIFWEVRYASERRTKRLNRGVEGV